MPRCDDPDCKCYEIEPGVWVHPPRVGHEWVEWKEKWNKRAAEKEAAAKKVRAESTPRE